MMEEGIKNVHKMSEVLMLVTIQLLLTLANGQFMKGSAPEQPNRVLEACQQRATIRHVDATYSGQHAQAIYHWCSMYDDVVPCLYSSLPATSNVDDWYLSLVYDYKSALTSSRSICERFRRIYNLTCVDEGMPHVESCMKSSITDAVTTFGELYNVQDFWNATPIYGDRINTSATEEVYACVIAVGTAGCFYKQLTSCPLHVRRLVYDYYMMLSGRCADVAGSPKDMFAWVNSIESTTTSIIEITTPYPTTRTRARPRGNNTNRRRFGSTRPRDNESRQSGRSGTNGSETQTGNILQTMWFVLLTVWLMKTS